MVSLGFGVGVGLLILGIILIIAAIVWYFVAKNGSNPPGWTGWMTGLVVVGFLLLIIGAGLMIWFWSS